MWGKNLKKKKNKKKDLHLHLDSRAVFSFYMCKSTTWFLCKQSTNSERVIPWSTEYRFIFLTFKSPIYVQVQVILKKLNGTIFLLLEQKYFIILNFLFCDFNLIIIKVTIYIQCQRWVIKLSFKRKTFGEHFLCHKKKIV